MKVIKSNIDLGCLGEALLKLPCKVDGTGVLMANGQFKAAPWGWTAVTYQAMAEIEEFLGAKALYVMINTIEPGKETVRHVDPLPDGKKLSRWHLPVLTNEMAWFWCEEEGEINLRAGWWHGPVEYWNPHAVGNRGTTSRTHLIVDLE